MDRSFVITQDRYITAVLETPIVDYLPGEVRAQQDRPVYGATGRHVLLPAGTRWIGHYNQGSQLGISRVDINWERVILPDGTSAVFNWSAADMMGRAGVPGDRDLQLVERYGAFLLETTFDMALAATAGASNSGTSTVNAFGGTTTTGGNQAMMQAMQQSGQNFQKITEGVLGQAFSIRPAISVPKGTAMVIYPGTDLWLRQNDDDGQEIVPVDPLAAKRVASSRQRAQDRSDSQRRADEAAQQRISRIGPGAATPPPPSTANNGVSYNPNIPMVPLASSVPVYNQVGSGTDGSGTPALSQ